MLPQAVWPCCLWISNVGWVPARCIFPIRPLPLFLNLVILTGCKKILWRLRVYFGYWECFFSFIWVLFVFFQKVPVWTFHLFLPWSVPAPSFLYGYWEPNTGLPTAQELTSSQTFSPRPSWPLVLVLQVFISSQCRFPTIYFLWISGFSVILTIFF